MRVSEALELFGNVTKIRTILQTLDDVGLGYMSLSAPTMSGGEAQPRETRRGTRPPQHRQDATWTNSTTGLHFDDIRKLLIGLHRLGRSRQHGHRRRAQPGRDQDRGLHDRPAEAGIRGGQIVAKGTPEQVRSNSTPAFDADRPHLEGRLKPVRMPSQRSVRPEEGASKAISKSPMWARIKSCRGGGRPEVHARRIASPPPESR
ncbi:MAG: hypothetical protein U0791_04575 [Gemmataceae bacterium]